MRRPCLEKKWARRAISACHPPPQDQKGRHTAGKELFDLSEYLFQALVTT